MEKHLLSKSTFIKGIQCEKALYYHKYKRELSDEISAAHQAIFLQGTSIGELARELFPGGLDCSTRNDFNFQSAVIITRKEIEKGTNITYEATFQYDGVLAVLDILVNHVDGWRAYEVKSSTEISLTHELDATIQYYTIINSGIDLLDISIVHINYKYEKNGPIDIRELFVSTAVKSRALGFLPLISNQVQKLKSILLNDSEPNVDICSHCSNLYPCNFKGNCWKDVPNYSIFNIAGLGPKKKFFFLKIFLKTTL